MCGIVARVHKTQTEEGLVKSSGLVEAATSRLTHRGPDFAGSCRLGSVCLGHSRLAIVDPGSGAQPIQNDSGASTVNGEIYNHLALRRVLEMDGKGSDCAVVGPACAKWGAEAPMKLSGIFAFVWCDGHGRWMTARDPIGVVPMYFSEDDEGWWFASERKALPDVALEPFPAGHVMGSDFPLTRYFRPEWTQRRFEDPAADLRRALEASVHRRRMSDVEFGVLLSGGLDSSVIAAIAQRIQNCLGLAPLKSFAIGISPNSPDLVAARRVAEHIGTDHHEITYTLEEGVAEIPNTIWSVETDDVTTVRASAPMIILARAVREAGCRVVLSGEGADEALCGYLYWHHTPSPQEGLDESRRRVLELGKYDCLRANLSTMAAGVEARVPFLDLSVLEVAMRCGPTKLPRSSPMREGDATRFEKALLREACRDLLPEEILWRQKEQFGDGVGYGWIDRLRQEATTLGFKDEAEWYRSVLSDKLPGAVGSIPPWTPKWIESKDPSGRVVPSHLQTSDKK